MVDKKVYFNKPQRLTQLVGGNTTVIVAGRRIGKTDSIAAPVVLRNIKEWSDPQVASSFPLSNTVGRTRYRVCLRRGNDGAFSTLRITLSAKSRQVFPKLKDEKLPVDTLYIGCEKLPFRDSFSPNVGYNID